METSLTTNDVFERATAPKQAFDILNGRFENFLLDIFHRQVDLNLFQFPNSLEYFARHQSITTSFIGLGLERSMVSDKIFQLSTGRGEMQGLRKV